jgi:hypothetical protein
VSPRKNLKGKINVNFPEIKSYKGNIGNPTFLGEADAKKTLKNFDV